MPALLLLVSTARAADPAVVGKHWQLARAYMAKGMPHHAEEEARVVLRLDPAHAGAKALLESHHLAPEGGETPVTSTATAGSGAGTSLAAESTRAYRESRTEDARALAAQALLAEPGNVDARDVLRRLAEETYQPTPLGSNDVLKELFEQAMALFRREEWAGAAAGFQKALATSPTHDQTRTFFTRSRARAEESRTGTAMTQAREAVAAGRPAEAKASLRSVLEINPGHAEALALLASLGEDARAADRKAQAKSHFNLGVEAYEQGRWADAVREWDLVTTLDPADQEAAKLLRKARARQSAARKEARARVPGMHDEAQKLFQQGKLAEARALYRDILELDPADDRAKRGLELIDGGGAK